MLDTERLELDTQLATYLSHDGITVVILLVEFERTVGLSFHRLVYNDEGERVTKTAVPSNLPGYQ